MYRGIKNVSRVSCHLACAIQIFVHGIPPIRQTLELLQTTRVYNDFVSPASTVENTSDEEENNQKDTQSDSKLIPLIEEILDFMGRQSEDNPTDHLEAWNPRVLYRYLQQADGTIDGHEVGDSSSTLSKIMHVLASVSPEWDNLLRMSVWKGTTRQVLVGMKRLPNGDWIQREKRQSKSKHMTCPFVIKIPSQDTSIIKTDLQDCIRAMVEPQQIHGEYPWDSRLPESYVERQIGSDEFKSMCYGDETVDGDVDLFGSWTTTKKIQLHEIPRVWLLHMERPNWRRENVVFEKHDDLNDDEMKFLPVDIPLHMDLAKLTNTDIKERNETSMVLQGAIVQVRYFEENQDENDDQEGHCFTILRSDDNGGTASETWLKLDDENCEFLSETQALEIMGGCVKVTKGGSRFFGASLLVYASPNPARHDDWNRSKQSIRESWNKLLKARQTTRSRSEFDLVGCRLQVKWSKGKYYTGIVTAYDPESGKHQVTYDDGDIRSYCLAKKTVIWLED
jgi:Ubiquitin carboxyl-terminal hydrolase